MQSLDEKEWGVFKLEDEFECAKGIYLPTGDVTDGDDPFITAKSGNNGLTRFIGNGTLFGGNRITIEKIRLSAYYQSAPFYCSHDVSVINNNNLDANNSQFIAEMIMRNGSKYSYGRQAQLNVVKRERIMLPVTDSGEPDYAYMAEYVQQKRDTMLAKYRAYVEARIAELGKAIEIPALDEKEWHEFRIGDLFGISRPVARNKDNYLPGDVPFVASGSINNGVMKLCEPLEDEQLDEGCCITVSPVDGSTFFQPMNFLGRGGAGSSILMLRCEGLNLYRGQFMARAIQQTCSKYTYGHMGNKDSIKRERIMLPVTDSGEPDYEYMEQYSKNMMLRKYQQYLTFLQQRSDAR